MLAVPCRLLWPNSEIQQLAPSQTSRLKVNRRNTWKISSRSSSEKSLPKLVTVLGKGGAGKTTAAVLLAKYFSSTGRSTCLVVQSGEDTTADELLAQRLKALPCPCGENLSAFRLETTKLLLEPLNLIKKADARLGFSQGALDEVAGEELSVLPGVDSLMAVAVLERLAMPAGGLLDFLPSDSSMADFDVVVFDGSSSSEALRMFGSPERSRWYLRRFRSLAEKTDAGRVALPSVARLLDSVMNSNSSDSRAERTSAEIWEAADRVLTRAVDAFQDSNRFSAFLVANPNSQSSVRSSLRYWGGAMQAGIHVAGVLLSQDLPEGSGAEESFSPLKIATLPGIHEGSMVDWKSTVEGLSSAAKEVFEGRDSGSLPPAVKINVDLCTVEVFLPGFDKSEVKLSQWRGKSELLIEVGDQRRSISIPESMQGKVVGAKFMDNVLKVSLKKKP